VTASIVSAPMVSEVTSLQILQSLQRNKFDGSFSFQKWSKNFLGSLFQHVQNLCCLLYRAVQQRDSTQHIWTGQGVFAKRSVQVKTNADKRTSEHHENEGRLYSLRTVHVCTSNDVLS
jgi:hypothetical protein